MQSAKVALFEHNRQARDLLRGAVHYPAIGHRVVSEAPSLGTALHVVSLIRSGHREIDAIILPANMTTGEENGRDAKILANRLHALDVTPKLIGYSSRPLANYGVTVDATILHEDLAHDIGQMARVLASL